MNRCSICYEDFIFPKNSKEFCELLKNNVINEYETDGITNTWESLESNSKFLGLVIMDKHDSTYMCPNPLCKSVICGHCMLRIRLNGKNFCNFNNKDYFFMDLPNIFLCPYCTYFDKKKYMIDFVLPQLMVKINGKKEYEKQVLKIMSKNFSLI